MSGWFTSKRSGLRALLGCIVLLTVFSTGVSAATLSTPADDPADISIWPNRVSRANSDAWLVRHHDLIRRMQPRLLVLNFSNQARRDHLDGMLDKIIAALAEGSRYHGYKDQGAPAFLQYRLFKFVDLRDAGGGRGNSTKLPLKTGVSTGFNLDYNRFFSEEFARYYGVRDPKRPERFLRLAELVEGGYVHELWFFVEHDEHFRAYEVVEEKPCYDESFHRIGRAWVQAGNGGDGEQKWTGRSLRIAFINASRGVGCFMESLSHGIEGTAQSGAIPYFSRHFRDYAGMNLNRRYPQYPWVSFYALGPKDRIDYPDSKTAVISRDGRRITLHDYIAHGGNVHFTPNGRFHYDLQNRQGVLSTIEDWRIGSGPGGRDLAQPWDGAVLARYRHSAPDCMGPWLIYWRQNFPGLHNRQKDEEGRRMKNWWP
ncbi:MAG: hypothetical protein KBG09_05660, partial [Syntrophobacterales bacterium]|nr:hypothetical protein [Syntrophobacterales bacterium]